MSPRTAVGPDREVALGLLLSLGAQPAAPVTDAAGALSPADRRALDSTLTQLRQRTRAHIVVAAMPSFNGQPALRVATTLGAIWKVGTDVPAGDPLHESGVVIVFSPQEHAMAIALADGITGWLPRPRFDAVLRESLALFRRGAYADALRLLTDDFTDAVDAHLRGAVIDTMPVIRRLVPRP